MPEVRHLTRQKLVEATIDLGDGDSVTMSFDANKVTPRWMNEAMERIQEQDMLSLCQALSDVLTGWDVSNEGQSFPPSKENIAVLSFPAVNKLFEEVCRSAAPSDAEGNASSPSSSAPPLASVEESQNSPNGTAIETSQAPSASLPSP